jgi:RHS repeat-associated protein
MNLRCHFKDITKGYTKHYYAGTERYFYHPDHLGSASWITDSSGKAIQHLQYLPFGEIRVDQRATSWSTRYSFSAKEKDEESGYGYFGVRYYDSDISIWLSVDPMSDKYPYQTPYLYCANNPLKIVDINGEDEWELNTTTGTFSKIGDKGGTTTDHYNIGTTNEKGRFVTEQTQSIDRDEKNNINSL